MSIIEEALQRKAEEEREKNGQEGQGVAPPPVRPPRKPEEKRGPLFWILVVLLVISVGIVSGLASYLYIFGGSLSDLAYLLPVSREEQVAPPKPFSPPKANNKVKEETPPAEPKPEKTMAKRETKSTPEENKTGLVPPTQELKSPWRVLTSQEKEAEAPEKANEEPSKAITQKGEKKELRRNLKVALQNLNRMGIPLANPMMEAPNTMEQPKKMMAQKAQQPVVKTAPSPSPKMASGMAKTVNEKPQKHLAPKPNLPAMVSAKKASPPISGSEVEKHNIPKSLITVQKREEASQKAIVAAKKTPPEPQKREMKTEKDTKPQQPSPPPLREEAESKIEVSTHKAPEHPYYQEEKVEEVAPGTMEFQKAQKPNPKEVVKRYLRLAIDSQEKGDDVHAIRLYKKVLEKEPNCVEALNNLASIYLKKGMIWRAEPLINKAFAFAPHKVEVITNKAYIEFKKGHYFLAEGLWHQALNYNSSYVPAMLGLGTLYLAEGCPTDAQRILSQALELEPNNPKVIYNLALAMDRCERYEEAISLYQELLNHHQSMPQQVISKVVARLYELQKSREGTGIKAMKREKGTW